MCPDVGTVWDNPWDSVSVANTGFDASVQSVPAVPRIFRNLCRCVVLKKVDTLEVQVLI